jgi:hypothetical protein
MQPQESFHLDECGHDDIWPCPNGSGKGRMVVEQVQWIYIGYGLDMLDMLDTLDTLYIPLHSPHTPYSHYTHSHYTHRTHSHYTHHTQRLLPIAGSDEVAMVDFTGRGEYSLQTTK